MAKTLLGSKKNKIVFLLTQDLQSPSGLGRYFPIAKALTSPEQEIVILALHSNFYELTGKDAIREGVRVKYVGQMHVLKKGNKTTYFKPLKLLWVTFVGTVSLLFNTLRESPIVLILGKPHPMNGVAGSLVKLFQKPTVILDCDDYEAASNHFGNKTQFKIVKWFEDNLPRMANWVTSNTHFTRQRLIGLGISPEKICYIPNGVDLDGFLPADQDKVDQLRATLTLNGKKVIGYLGSLNLENHPVNLLIDSLPRIKRDVPNCRLLIVGGGKDLDLLKRQAEDLGVAESVSFTGRVPADQIHLYYQLCDVTIDPVLDDDAARGRCPLKMFESWASGIPFLTMDVGDRRLLAGDPPAAVIIPPGSSEELSKAVIDLLNDQEKTAALVESGLSKARDYSWHKIINEPARIFIRTGGKSCPK